MPTVTIEQAMQLAQEHLRAGRFGDAKLVFQRILEIEPNHGPAHYWLGDLLLREGDAHSAVGLLQRAAQSNPSTPECFTRLGFALLGVQQIDEAAAAFERAIAIDPNSSAGHYGLSWTLLARGDFDRGWREHEWRATCKTLPGNVRSFAQPRWDGSNLAGKTILLYQEQGLGDVLQYVRYAPMVAARGGRVILGCPEHLGTLLRATPGITDIAPSPNRLPPFDVHISLHSLPQIFATTLETIPANGPYVFPDSAAVERWSKRIPKSPGIFSVGLCWSGSPKHENDRLRSIDPAELEALTGVKNVRFYNLQKDLTAEQARRLPSKLNLVDLGPDLRDFADTAAAMTQLDLVISVDTSIAHLAGAMAKKTWTLVPFHADWRWMLKREDSPWYPTMRLFRQLAPRDWPPVLAQVASELQTSAKA
jgi:Tfp pilus assembly protein PilF